MNVPDGSGRADRAPYSLNEKIDVCRGLFAMMVVVGHSFEMAVALSPSPTTWDEGLPAAAAAFLTFVPGTGVYYVMGFFILSGYCIQASVGRLATDGAFPLRTYLAARATRILPLYYAALLFAAAVEWATRAGGVRPVVWSNGLDRGTLLFQTLLIQNFTQTFGSFAPSWSITNEAAYYVLFGLVAAVCVPLGKRPATAGTALCVAVGLALQIAYRLGARGPILLGTGLLFGHGAIWHLGALVRVHEADLAGSRRIAAIARAWPAVLALSMAMWAGRHVHQEFVFVAAGVAFALMMVRFAATDRAAKASGRPPSATIRPLPAEMGLTSYPMYLFHGPILLAFGAVVRALGISPPWWAGWPCAALFAIGVCLPLGRLLEAPLMSWRAGVLKRLKTSGRPAATPPPLGATR